MSEALALAYPSTTLQTLAGWQERKALAIAMRAIYSASSADAASAALDAVAVGAWGRRFPTIVKMWPQA
jgi:putative transposase